MPIFIYRGRYSADAVKGMMTSPEDREAVLAKVFEKAGGKLLAFYLTFGEDDFLTIADCPDHHAALALAIAGAAGGSISDMKTTVAVTSKEAMAAFKRAGECGENVETRGTLTGYGEEARMEFSMRIRFDFRHGHARCRDARYADGKGHRRGAAARRLGADLGEEAISTFR